MMTIRNISFALVFPALTLIGNHFYFKAELSFSILSGALIMLLNVGILTWAWHRIFIKKSIALAASVIVIKYAIIGLIIYWLVQEKSINVYGLVLGITSVIPSLFLVVIIDHKKRNERIDGTF